MDLRLFLIERIEPGGKLNKIREKKAEDETKGKETEKNSWLKSNSVKANIIGNKEAKLNETH